jgi:hypothetical protein
VLDEAKAVYLILTFLQAPAKLGHRTLGQKLPEGPDVDQCAYRITE